MDESLAGVVLAGGRSSRMGTPKASLEWHGSTLLRRTVGILARAVEGPVVVVRAPGQALPALPSDVEVREDLTEGLGPMQGLAVGLEALSGQADVAFVCSTDLPFLHPVFVRAVVHAVTDDTDVALPMLHGFPQPLAAAYRTALAPVAGRLLLAGRLRPAFLFEECRVTRLSDADLRADPLVSAYDPGLDSVANVNEPDDYAAARALPAPEVVVQCFGAPAAVAGRGPRIVRVATVGAAAAAVSLTLDGHVLAALNGDQITRDVDLPLATGDTVVFISADAGG